MAFFSGQISRTNTKKPFSPNLKLKYTWPFFVVGFPTKHLGVSKITILALLIYCKHFLCSLKCKSKIQNHNIRFVQLKFTCQVLARGSKETVVVGMGQLQLSTFQKVSQTSGTHFNSEQLWHKTELNICFLVGSLYLCSFLSDPSPIIVYPCHNLLNQSVML